MSFGSFKGGVHPSDGKHYAKENPFRRISPKGEFAFMLSQHIGAPAKALVAKGDTVKKGQLIAQSGGFVSSPVYSSVDGTVTKIESRLSTSGGMCNAIIVKPDENQGEPMLLQTKDSIDEWTREEILDRISEAGIVGMGGAGFPTHVKLMPKNPEAIDYIIINAAECEPYITCDYRRMLENTDEIVEGLKLVLKCFPNAKGVIAIEDNKPDCIKIMTEAVKGFDNIHICPLKTKYPQGGERQLIYAVTGRKINSSMLPADAGCVVDNIETVYSIYNAIAKGLPVIERSMTISGDAVKTPCNLIVPIGMDHGLILEEAGGLNADGSEKYISGGPMMGFAIPNTDIPTTKTSSALLVFTKDIVNSSTTTACINCARCVSVCPENIVPSRLAKAAERNDIDEFVHWNGLECIECGCCSYVCPARRHLKQAIGNMKRQTLGKIKSGEYVLPSKKEKKEEK